MAIPHNLRRKLREVFGSDAGDDLVNLLEVAQATRGDIAELRHTMELRLSAIDARFASLEAQLRREIAGVETKLEKGLKEQTRFFFLAWAVQIAAIVGLYAR